MNEHVTPDDNEAAWAAWIKSQKNTRAMDAPAISGTGYCRDLKGPHGDYDQAVAAAFDKRFEDIAPDITPEFHAYLREMAGLFAHSAASTMRTPYVNTLAYPQRQEIGDGLFTVFSDALENICRKGDLAPDIESSVRERFRAVMSDITTVLVPEHIAPLGVGHGGCEWNSPAAKAARVLAERRQAAGTPANGIG